MNTEYRICRSRLHAITKRMFVSLCDRSAALLRFGRGASPVLSALSVAVIAGGGILAPVAYAQEGPELSLDVSALVQDIHVTREVATDVEASLFETLQGVEQQTEALKKVGCTPENTSSQCLAMKKDLREKYMGVLDSVEQRLPTLKNSVGKVVASIEERMGRQAGASASDVQSELIAASGAQNGSSVKPRLRLQGVSGSRLSESLGRLQALVSTSGTTGVSMQTMQNDLYLDMRDSLRILENLDAAIQNTRIIAAVQLGEMSISDEQMSVAQEAQGYIFGQPDTAINWLDSADTNTTEGEDDFKSDLEL